MINKITLVTLFLLFNFIASAQEVVHENLPDTKLVLDKTYTVVLGEEVLENGVRSRPSKPKTIHFEKVARGSEIFIKAIFEDETHKHGFLMQMDEVEDTENYIEHYEYTGDDDDVRYATMTFYKNKMLVEEKEMDFNIEMEGYWGKKTYSLYLNTNHKLLKSPSLNDLPSLSDLPSLGDKPSSISPNPSTNNSLNIVKFESLSDNPLYEIKIENKSKLTINVYGGGRESLNIKSIGEEYKDGMQVHNFMVLDDPRYKIVGIFDMSELNQSERVNAMGVACPVLITIGGGNKKAITIAAKFVSGHLPKVKNSKMIHKELTSLFESMENGFSDQKKEEKKLDPEGETKKVLQGHDTEFYASDMELGYLENSEITKVKEVIYYEATISDFMTSQIEQILQALESYPSSGAFKISQLNGDDSNKNYVIKKSNKTKGFIRFFKNNITEIEKWSFQIFEALDRNQMKASLLEGVDLIENNLNALKGKKIKEGFIEAKIRIPGAYKASFTTFGEGGREWRNIFASYPLEALKHQIKNMDIKMDNRSNTIEEKMGGYVFYFNNNTSDILIYVVKINDSPLPSVGVSYIPN